MLIELLLYILLIRETILVCDAGIGHAGVEFLVTAP